MPAPLRHLATTATGPVCYIDSGGDGPAVVLVHGWCMDGWWNFARAYDALVQAGWRVVVPDLPGHGRTPSLGHRTLLDLSASVVSLLDYLEIETATWLGYSMGGAVCQLIARNHPSRVRSLVLVATAAHLAPGAVRPIPGWLLSLGEAGGRVSDVVLEHFGSRLRKLLHGEVAGMLSAGGELVEFDSRDWVGLLRCPVTCVVSTRDRIVPERAQTELAELTQAKVIRVSHGHRMCWSAEFGEIVARAVGSSRCFTGWVDQEQ